MLHVITLYNLITQIHNTTLTSTQLATDIYKTNADRSKLRIYTTNVNDDIPPADTCKVL